MLIKAKELKGYSLKSLDGTSGRPASSSSTTVLGSSIPCRNTASWLSGSKVLISPYSLNGVNNSEEQVSVQLTRKEIEDSPSITTDEPVSFNLRTPTTAIMAIRSIGWLIHVGGYPYIVRDRTRWGLSASKKMGWNRHLRSTKSNGLPSSRA